MSASKRYFDYAATTPVDPRVIEAMLPYLRDEFGNANSLHGFGHRAYSAVEHAREQISMLIGAEDPSEIIFTSGATEANNWIVRTFSSGWISPFEHSSMMEPARRAGYKLLESNEWQVQDPGPSDLISVMRVNNETGAILTPAHLRQSAKFLHSDITQAVGKIDTRVQALELDAASMSAHKLYGPKGVGALYLKTGSSLEPLILGGEQENGLRGGTLNVPAIVGFGKAAQLAIEEREADEQHAHQCRAILLDELKTLSDLRINTSPIDTPFIVSLSFGGLVGETLIVELDSQGFALSSGAACSSRSTEPSHVLTALGLEDYWLNGTVRISFGRFVSKDGVFELAKALKDAVGTIRRLTM